MFKSNQFKCPVCLEIRERGVFVQLGPEAGGDSGVIVKVCKKGRCQQLAEAGIRIFPETDLMSLILNKKRAP